VSEADHIHAVQLVRSRGSWWTARAWYRIGPGRFATVDYGLHASPAAAYDGLLRTIERMDNTHDARREA